MPAPANDNLIDAEVLTSPPGSVGGTTVGSTSEPHDWAYNDGVWYVAHANTGDFDLSIIASYALYSEIYFGDYGESDYENLEYQNYIGDGTNSPPPTTVPITSDDTYIYIFVTNWDGDATQGTFTLDYDFVLSSTPPPITVTGNDLFANAYEFLTDSGSLFCDNTGYTSDGIDDPLDQNYGKDSRTAWFKLPASSSYRNVTLTLARGSNINPYIGLFLGSTLADLFDPGQVFGYNHTPFTYTVPGDVDVYIEVTGGSGANFGTFKVSWSLVDTGSPTPDGPSQAIELKSPSAPFTTYPGGAIAIRLSDFMAAARGTLSTGTDSDSPTGDYVVDTQHTTGTTSGTYYAVGLENAMADSIDFAFADVGCLQGIRYGAFILAKAVGVAPNDVSKTSETFHTKTCARFYYNFDEVSSYTFGAQLDNNSEDQWRYYNINSFVIQSFPSAYNLKLKAFSFNDPGVEIRMAQIVLIPNGVSGTTLPDDWNSDDFDQFQYLYNYTPGPDVASSGWLGGRTVDGALFSGYGGEAYQSGFGVNPDYQVVEYQRALDEYEVSDYTQQEWPYQYVSRVWHWAGMVWYSARTLLEETFTRTVVAKAGAHFFNTSDPTYDPAWDSSWGTTDYGYQWWLTALWGDMSHDWGYDAFYGPEQKSWVEIDGSQALIVCGGYDTGLMGIKAEVGYNLASYTNYPTLRDVVDYVIEGSVSMPSGTLDSDGVALVGAIGKSISGGDGGIMVMVEWQSDGSLEVRLQVAANRIGAPTYPWHPSDPDVYVVDGPVVFDSGAYSGAKINLKLCRQRYVVKAKVWYDTDDEPSSWTLEGFLPGIRQSGTYPSYTYHFFDYPYDEEVGYSIVATGFNYTYFDSGNPFFASHVALEQIVPSDNGGQYGRVTFAWDDFKVSYDPDGNTDVEGHLMIKDGATTFISDTPIPMSRQVFLYLGKRLWGRNGGQQYYLSVDDDAATLIGTMGSWSFWRKVLYESGAAITGVISMRYRQHKQR